MVESERGQRDPAVYSTYKDREGKVQNISNIHCINKITNASYDFIITIIRLSKSIQESFRIFTLKRTGSDLTKFHDLNPNTNTLS